MGGRAVRPRRAQLRGRGEAIPGRALGAHRAPAARMALVASGPRQRVRDAAARPRQGRALTLTLTRTLALALTRTLALTQALDEAHDLADAAGAVIAAGAQGTSIT